MFCIFLKFLKHCLGSLAGIFFFLHPFNGDVYPTKNGVLFFSMVVSRIEFDLPSNNRIPLVSETFVALFRPHHAKGRGEMEKNPLATNECSKSSNYVQLIIQVTPKLLLIREPPRSFFLRITLPETNSSPLKNTPSPKETIVFQPSIFRC